MLLCPVEQAVMRNYHHWLVSQVDVDNNGLSQNYSKLLDILDDTIYTFKGNMDENRSIEGLSMRERYDLTYNHSDILVDNILKDRPSSILECFVACFTRFSDTVWTLPGDKSVAPELFYDALSSLNLLYFDDFHYDEDAISRELLKFLHKKVHVFGEKNTDLWSAVNKFAMKKWGV